MGVTDQQLFEAMLQRQHSGQKYRLNQTFQRHKKQWAVLELGSRKYVAVNWAVFQKTPWDLSVCTQHSSPTKAISHSMTVVDNPQYSAVDTAVANRVDLYKEKV